MVETFLLPLLAGSVLGFLAGLGVGGGSLLILWLTVVLHTPQAEARLLNLMFFLPCAVISCLFRWRQGTLQLRRILPAVIAGCTAAGAFSFLSGMIDTAVLKKLFGGLLLITGLRELFYRPRNAR